MPPKRDTRTVPVHHESADEPSGITRQPYEGAVGASPGGGTPTDEARVTHQRACKLLPAGFRAG